MQQVIIRNKYIRVFSFRLGIIEEFINSKDLRVKMN